MYSTEKGNWEDNLSTALKTVDDSIQNLKRQFSGLQENQISPNKSFFTSGQTTLQYQSPLFPKYESTPRDHARPGLGCGAAKPFATREESGSSSLLSSLLQRFDEQSETITSLSNAVTMLKQDNAAQLETINALKDQVHQLSNSYDNGLVQDLEFKLSKVHKELKAEISALKGSGKEGKSKDPTSRNVAALSKNLQENKKLWQHEIAALKIEMDHLKTRIVKFELDLSSSAGNYKELSRKYDKMEMHISSLGNVQKNLASRLDQLDENNSLALLDHLNHSDTSLRNSKKKKRSKRKGKVNHTPLTSSDSERKTLKTGDPTSKRSRSRRKASLATDSDLSGSMPGMDESNHSISFGDLDTEDLIRGGKETGLFSSSQSSAESDLLQSF